MVVDRLKHHGSLVDALGSGFRGGDHLLSTVPALLKRVLQEGAWREFVTSRGELVRYDNFREFVETPPLKGLGGTLDLVKRVVADDPETLDEVDRALQRSPGRPVDVNLDNVKSFPSGNSAAQALRRLRKDAPEIHEKVITGEMSPNAGMRKAGLRPRTLTVRPDDPDYTARALRRQMTPENLATLIVLLVDEQEA